MLEGYRTLKILSNEEIASNIFEIKLEIGSIETIKPGHFFMIRGWEGNDPFLPRPISVADVEEGVLTFLYEVRGRGTHIISKICPGDTLDILGPLGNGFQLNKAKRTALISGGIGIAPMFYLLKELEGEIDFYAGFRNEVYWMEKIEKVATKLDISTEDGSCGHKGFCIDNFNPKEYDQVLTCGPIPMMKRVVEMCQGIVPVQVSMESKMACGIGACLGCTIETPHGMKRVCKEGPVFKGEEVIF
nr:dihydroorotate dehydrogenase electron transfer subunit [Tissierella sp.]